MVFLALVGLNISQSTKDYFEMKIVFFFDRSERDYNTVASTCCCCFE